MFNWFFRTDNSAGSLFLRLSLGIVMFPHGAQKVLGWFGGGGYEKTVEMFTVKLGMPLWMPLLLMAIEFLGSLGLIAGFFTRLAALGIGGAMAVCAYLNHLKNGFFMNWMGQQQGEGFEFHILVVGIALALMVRGAGLWSVDGALSKGKRR